MRNLEYRILNMKNLLEYIKTVQHLRRDKADMWIHVSDHNPSVFDRIQLEVNPENNFIINPHSLLFSPFSNEYEENCTHTHTHTKPG